MKHTDFRWSITMLFTLLLLSTTSVFAGTAEDSLFQKANAAYSRGDYAEAIAQYEQITKNAGYSPGVLYNLANSYALSGHTGKAILNYERALRLSPSDSDISGNLELVKKEYGLFPKEATGTEQFFRILSLNQWTALIAIALTLLTIFLLATIKLRFSRQLNIGVGSSCILLICLAIAGTGFRYQYFNPAVVISPETRLFVSPFESSAAIGALQEGRLVYPQKNHGDYSYVTDETDRKGWLPTARIEPVCGPAHSGS